MKLFILQVVTLCFVLFTNSLFGTGSDSLVRKEIGIQLSGGTRATFKGMYFTGGFYYSKNKKVYSLQYNFYRSHYVKLTDFTGYLEQMNSIALLMGRKIPIHKFNIVLSGGLNVGTGQFATVTSHTRNYYLISDNTSYFATNFFGPVFNCTAKYDLTDRISLGASITALVNLYFQYQPSSAFSYSQRAYSLQGAGNFLGLQVCAAYKLKQWTRKKTKM